MRFMIFLFSIFPLFLQAQPKITCYQNEAVKSIRPILDEWGIQLYREYPYLYVYQEETDYNTIFEVDPEAFVIFAEREGKKLGVIQANPLNSPYLEQELYTPYAYLDQIRKKGFDPAKILYISCFLMVKEERQNHEAIILLFDRAIELAKTMGKTQICYMEIVQDSKPLLKPVSYIPLEPWLDLNKDFSSMDVPMQMRWPTLQVDGSVKEEVHTMALYIMEVL